MNAVTNDLLDQLEKAVQASAKYRRISPDFIRRLGSRELSKRSSLKEAIKETKNRMHQAAGAYLDSAPNYGRGLATLRGATGHEAMKDACRAIMAEHASTRERLPLLETFYPIVLADVGELRSVLDIACGLNPLALPWMPLKSDLVLRYECCDLYADMILFLNEFFVIAGAEGRADVRDVITPPTEEADVALILKFLPVLEQSEKGTAGAWLRAISARYLLVSFPTRSLGGHGKGMTEHYEGWFRELIQAEKWNVQRTLFPNELCFLIER